MADKGPTDMHAYGLSQQSVNERCMGYATWAELPKFEEIKPEDFPPFGKKGGRILCSENITIFYLLVTENEPIIPVLTSPNNTEITGTK